MSLLDDMCVPNASSGRVNTPFDGAKFVYVVEPASIYPFYDMEPHQGRAQKALGSKPQIHDPNCKNCVSGNPGVPTDRECS